MRAGLGIRRHFALRYSFETDLATGKRRIATILADGRLPVMIAEPAIVEQVQNQK